MMIMREVKMRNENLSVAWIDYKKDGGSHVDNRLFENSRNK